MKVPVNISLFESQPRQKKKLQNLYFKTGLKVAMFKVHSKQKISKTRMSQDFVKVCAAPRYL